MSFPDGTVGPRLARAHAWHWWLAGLNLLGLGAFVLFPIGQQRLGLFDHGRWFLDSYAVLAASDTAHAGLDPAQPMALDVLHRAHSYSDWWLGLRWLGLTRADNFLVGSAWVAAFLVSAWAVLRPRHAAPAAWHLSLLLSPAVLLAINRANNDLVIFTLLTGAALLWRPDSPWRVAGALGAIALATGLKFYPVAAGALVLLTPPGPTRWKTAGAVALLLGVVLLNVWEALGRGAFALPSTVYLFGATVFGRDLGGTGRGLLVGGAVAMLGLAVLAARRGRLQRPAIFPAAPRATVEAAAFTIGASVLLACFVGGISYAYRGIFFLLTAPWLWRRATATQRSPDRCAARWSVGLVTATLWLDGGFCVVTNLTLAPMAPAFLDRLQHTWRLVSQPVPWAAAAMLAGWLLALGRHAWTAELERFASATGRPPRDGAPPTGEV